MAENEQSNLLRAGRYKARAVDGALGATKKGMPEVAIMFELTEIPGHRLAWYGFFTEKTEDRTLESLFHCGWDGESIEQLAGITENEVELDVEVEQQEDKDGNKLDSWRNRVRWVNSLGGGAQMLLGNELDDATKAQFTQAMRGRALALKAKLAQGKSAAPAKAGAAAGSGGAAATTADVGEPPPWAR